MPKLPDNITSRWQSLNEREQMLTLITLIVVVIIMFYALVWAPLNSNLAKSKASLDNQQSLLSWVQKNAGRAIQLKQSSGGKRSFSGSLPQAVNQTASRVGISISRMQPQSDQLMVWVDAAPFNDVLSWLQQLENRGVSILDLDLAEGDAPGMVKIRRLQLGKS